MPANALDRFKQRLALVAYFRRALGIADPLDSEKVSDYHKFLAELPRDGYDDQGRSYVYNTIKDRVHGIPAEALIRYDDNVRRHTERLNVRRTHQPITLKYFQVLAALATEHFLDRVTADRKAFLIDLNDFTQSVQRRQVFPPFEDGDLDKVAFWMATGSGKTLLLHLNYYQYLHYRPDGHENILLITPNEGLSAQHMAEMEKSGIPCHHFNADSADLYNADQNSVKVIEITKLVDEKSGEGKSVAVSSLEGKNLVFVDEGHKGTGSDAQSWRKRRQAIAADGFTFEYSATFGQAVGTSNDKDVVDEYAKAILIDYSYPRFYADGYGKDYSILNLGSDLDPGLTRHYLLANLLTFYAQVRAYHSPQRDELAREFNIAPPLLIFVGHSVTAGKNRSSLTVADKLSLSDVQELVLFLHEVLTNQGEWVPQAIDALRNNRTDLTRSNGDPLFGNAFQSLGANGAAIYAEMRRHIFHAEGNQGLELVNIKGSSGEIGLRIHGADRYFGLINIGDDANFLTQAEKKLDAIPQSEDQFANSLFDDINRSDSSINILLGAKKFVEGWDSWRVSTMGLLNIGRGEGPEIIQLFGRGVRLLGWNRALKRSSEIANLPASIPPGLTTLERLNIFGVRANYMAQFRDYLEQEGIDTGEREILTIQTQRQTDFANRGLLVIRPRIATPYEDAVDLLLRADPGIADRTTLDLHPAIDSIDSRRMATPGNGVAHAVPHQPNPIPARYLPYLDWNRIYHDIWNYRTQRGYRNLALDLPTLRSIITDGHYRLYCPDPMLTIAAFGEITKIERLVTMLLSQYVERFYTDHKRRWENEQLAYDNLGTNDPILVDSYEVQVRRTATNLLQELQDMSANPMPLYQDETGLPRRVHFDRHLYLPLIREHNSDDVTYIPQALNPGEAKLVADLRTYVQSNPAILTGWELFLLRNPSRGHGVGFLLDDGNRYFPDFILWLKNEDAQHVVFIDPHGLRLEGDPDVNPKVQFYRTIKDHESTLNAQAQRNDVQLHSFVISQTELAELRKICRLDTEGEFHARHIYFPAHHRYIKLILEQVISDTP